MSYDEYAYALLDLKVLSRPNVKCTVSLISRLWRGNAKIAFANILKAKANCFIANQSTNRTPLLVPRPVNMYQNKVSLFLSACHDQLDLTLPMVLLKNRENLLDLQRQIANGIFFNIYSFY